MAKVDDRPRAHNSKLIKVADPEPAAEPKVATSALKMPTYLPFETQFKHQSSESDKKMFHSKISW